MQQNNNKSYAVKRSSDGLMLFAKILACICGFVGLCLIFYLLSTSFLPKEIQKCSSGLGCSVKYPPYLFLLDIFQSIGFIAMFLFGPTLLVAILSLSIMLNPAARKNYSKNVRGLIPFIVLGFVGTIPGFYWVFAFVSFAFSALFKTYSS